MIKKIDGGLMAWWAGRRAGGHAGRQAGIQADRLAVS